MSVRSRLQAAAAFLGRVLQKSHADELGLRTSALAFSTVIAIVPLMAGISILLARTIRSDDRRILELAAALLPYREEAIMAALEGFLAHAESVSGVAILGFILTSVVTFLTVQSTLFEIFRVDRAPSLLRRLVAFSLLYFWGPFVIGAAQAGRLYVEQARPELAARLEESALFGNLPFLVTWLGLTMLYRRASQKSVWWREAAAGALGATIALELLTEVFQVYVAQFSAVQRAVYGTFAIVFFFVLSIQLAWWILLLGAEFAAVAAADRRGLPQALVVPEPDPWIALGALEFLAAPGRPKIAPHELAPRLGLDTPTTKHHLRPLVEAGVLESGGDYRLALPPHQVRIASVLAHYRRRLASSAAKPLPEHTAAIRIRLRRALEHDVGDETLADLMTEKTPLLTITGVVERPVSASEDATPLDRPEGRG